MRTLHWYLTRQVMVTLAMTVTVFAFVLLLGNVLKEILSLLVSQQASLGTVVRAIGLLVPFVLIFALPMGLLTATLLVFGRFSADHELTAARANGISLLSLISPLLLLSVVLSGVCAFINLQVAQQCRLAYKELLFRAGTAHPGVVLSEGHFLNDFPGYYLYVGRVRGEQLEDILLSQLEEQEVVRRLRATSGTFRLDTARRELELVLTNVWGVNLVTNETGELTEWVPFVMQEWPLSVEIKTPEQIARKPRYSELTFAQLWSEKRELERHGVDATPVYVQLHRQVAFSFACLSFTLVGIPLGIRAHRRETSVGIAIAILLVVLYYSFIILGQALETRAAWAPHLIVWLPNFIFQAMGAVLLWRANRGIV